MIKRILIFLGIALSLWVLATTALSLRGTAQIDAKMRRLLSLAGQRKWLRAGHLLSASYQDAWGQDKATALRNATEMGRHFLVLEILGTGAVSTRGAQGTWQGRLTFRGRGTAVGEMIFSRVESLQDDFVFAWRKENWKPWSWKLVSVTQPEIVFDSQWSP